MSGALAFLRDLSERTHMGFNNDPNHVSDLCCKNPAILFLHIDDKPAFYYPHVREEATGERRCELGRVAHW